MMNIGPEACGRLSLWEYGALLWHWNQAPDPDAKKHSGPIDLDKLRRFTSAHLS